MVVRVISDLSDVNVDGYCHKPCLKDAVGKEKERMSKLGRPWSELTIPNGGLIAIEGFMCPRKIV